MNDDLEYARRLVKYLEKYEENSNGLRVLKRMENLRQ
jgi:hypothetical protein